MRTRLFATTALVIATAAAGASSGASASPASVHHAAAPAPTVRVVVRPVTTAGRASAGFKVHNESDDVVDCSFADPSPGAVSRNIEFCSPSASYAIACWNAVSAHHVLCMRDPASKKVYKLSRTGQFAHTKLAPAAQRAPLLIVLTDGTRCDIRDGGAWGTLKSHPNWSGSYSCTRHGVVWASPHAKHNGVNESRTSWTVQTAAGTGAGKLHVRHVRRAYFVGTA
jgi:hypothetical protein